MRWNLVRTLVAVVVIFVVVGASLITVRNLGMEQTTSSFAAMNDLHAFGSFVPMSNQPVPLLRRAQYVRPTRPDQPLSLSIGLQPRNQQELTDLALAVRNPKSPLYHHFLTPGQFKERFAPTATKPGAERQKCCI